MPRIYIVTGRGITRYVRAHTLNGAIRAVAQEHFEAANATADDMVKAAMAGKLDVLDTTRKPEQADIDDKDDPGPVPLRAV